MRYRMGNNLKNEVLSIAETWGSDGNTIPVVFSADQATQMFALTYAQILCVDVPRARFCSRISDAIIFYSEGKLLFAERDE